MCRFLLCKSKTPVSPRPILSAFAVMAKKSKAFDGDWQGDGCGISVLGKNGRWNLYKSVKPIWEEVHLFDSFPSATRFLIHARSASFPQHKNNILFNQPYVNGTHAFVFNGLLRGVALPKKVPGIIGAEKIWHLLQSLLKKLAPEKALWKLKEYLLKYTRDAQALNIGFADPDSMHALCFHSQHPDYYRLRIAEKDSLKILSSEVIEGFRFTSIASNTIVTL